jgi:hypothetical protein
MRINDIEEILDEFDFYSVQKTMEALDWNYYDSPDKVPSIGELRRLARRLLEDVYEACSSEVPESIRGTGGFEATCKLFPDAEKKYLTLKFVVTGWHNYD